MALALWREAPLEEVLRVVCEDLQWLGGGQADAVQASFKLWVLACDSDAALLWRLSSTIKLAVQQELPDDRF